VITQAHPDHAITVTVGPVGQAVGRAWFDCSCGRAQAFPTKSTANTAALRHLHETSGCVCPLVVRQHPSHPEPERTRR
jgi:hypothetical protein